MLSRIRVVLVEPSHPGNVGSVARAMRVMGLRDLALVAPVIPDVADHADARALASGATDVLAAARVHARLEDAIGDVGLAVAISASEREFAPAPQHPDACASGLVMALHEDPALRVALVFGPERTGLSVVQAARCQWMCSIPGDPDYNSLNLAQAVQVMAWTMRRAALALGDQGAAAATAPADPSSAGGAVRRAPVAELEALYEHLERALIAVQFLDPAHPKKLMPRMRRLFARATLETEEVQLLRGICKQMELAAAGRLPAGGKSGTSAAGLRDTP